MHPQPQKSHFNEHQEYSYYIRPSLRFSPLSGVLPMKNVDGGLGDKRSKDRGNAVISLGNNLSTDVNIIGNQSVTMRDTEDLEISEGGGIDLFPP